MNSAGDGDSAVCPSGSRRTQSEFSSQDKDMAFAPPNSDFVRINVRMESPTVLQSGGICAPNDGSVVIGRGNECSATDQANMEASSDSRQNVEECMTHNLKISGASSFPMVGDDHVGDGSTDSSLEASGEKNLLVVIPDSEFGDVIDTINIPSMAHDPHFHTEAPSMLESGKDIEPEQVDVPKDGSMPLGCGANECSVIETRSDSQENVEESVTHNLKPSETSSLSIVGGDDYAGEDGPEASHEVPNGQTLPLIVTDSGIGDETDHPNVSSLVHDPHFCVEAHSVLESTKDIEPEQAATFKDAVENVKLESIGNDSPPRHQIIGNHVNAFNSSTCEDAERVLVDTASPFESVKEAVSRFGGITDWKAHKIHTAERRKLLQLELEKAQEEIPVVRKLLEASENKKLQTLAELAETDIAVEQLKLNLDRAETEEQQAKHDSDLLHQTAADLRQGSSDPASLALKSLLGLITSRCTAAAADLRFLNEEIHSTAEKYTSALAERDASFDRAKAAISTVRLTDRTVQKLAADLITLKESPLTEAPGGPHVGPAPTEPQSALKTTVNEVQNLKNEAELLYADLEKEKSAVNAVRRREGIASVTVASLEVELARIRSEITRFRAEEKAYKEETTEELPKKLQEAALEGDLAESDFEKSTAELHTLTREVELLWADLGVISGRVLAATKEAEACGAAERLALEAVRDGRAEVVTVSCEVYRNLKEVVGPTRMAAGGEMEEVKAELCRVKEQLEEALRRAERAEEGKLAVEQELRKWRAEHGQRRQEGESATVGPVEKGLVSRSGFGFGAGVEVVSEMVKVKKKKSFFPRVLMFFARRKARASAKAAG